MSDIYQSVFNKYKGSPAAVMLFIGALLMFVIGLNHFIEDTNSSKLGLESLERVYNLNVQVFQWSYWTMSLAPQIASIVFAYMWLSDTSRWGYGILALGFQAMDFFADSWYRSNGNLFEDMNVLAISAILTFVYFSVGSEFFITVGGGLLIKLTAPALATWKAEFKNVISAAQGKYQGQQQSQGKPPQNHHRGNDNGHQRQKGTDRRAELMAKYHGPDRRREGEREPRTTPVPYPTRNNHENDE